MTSGKCHGLYRELKQVINLLINSGLRLAVVYEANIFHVDQVQLPAHIVPSVKVGQTDNVASSVQLDLAVVLV